MKRFIAIVFFGAGCFFAGYMFSPRAGVAAQAPQTPAAAPGPSAARAVNGKGMYFPIDDIKKRFPPAEYLGSWPRSQREDQRALADVAFPVSSVPLKC